MKWLRRPTAGQAAAGLAAAALLAAAFAAGWHAHERHLPARPAPREVREPAQGDWRFINPLLECELAEGVLDRPALHSFRHRLVALADIRRAAGEIEQASIFFRELNGGPSFGVRSRTGYVPASLLKLPTLLAVLKRAERRPGLLRESVRFAGPRDELEMVASRQPERLEPGRSYTVEELCRRMVRYSDNDAVRLLNALVSAAELEATLRGLGVLPELVEAKGRLDVRTISSFLRVLYNASYLSREHAELALEMLSQAWFREGIIGGLPEGVQASGKYGEAILDAGGFQLHEVAIVYHARRPYLLGVMTQGRDVGALKRFLRDVSRTVYDEIDGQAGTPTLPGRLWQVGAGEEEDD